MDYLTTDQIMKLMDIKRARVSHLARLNKWRFETYKAGNCYAKKYLAEDVNKEAIRREQLRKDKPWLFVKR